MYVIHCWNECTDTFYNCVIFVILIKKIKKKKKKKRRRKNGNHLQKQNNKLTALFRVKLKNRLYSTTAMHGKSL